MELIYTLPIFNNYPKQLELIKQTILSICGEVTMTTINAGTAIYSLDNSEAASEKEVFMITIHTIIPQSVSSAIFNDEKLTSFDEAYKFIQSIEKEQTDIKSAFDSNMSPAEIMRKYSSVTLKEYGALTAIKNGMKKHLYPLKIKIVEVTTQASTKG